MGIVLRRLSIWFMVMVVALVSLYAGFQLAQGQAVADIGRTVGVELDARKKNEPPASCYKGPPQAKHRDQNPNCPP